jgi:uncharacterized protein with HEPN domain
MTETDRWRLVHIRDAISDIAPWVEEGEAAFRSSLRTQRAVLFTLQMIGEAARAVSAEFKADHPQTPWAQIVGMRNILAHEYFRVDLAIIWRVLVDELPKLDQQIQAWLATG